MKMEWKSCFRIGISLFLLYLGITYWPSFTSLLGLPAIWVLAAVTIGGGVMGITGMQIGVPVAAAVYRLISEDVNRIREKAADHA